MFVATQVERVQSIGWMPTKRCIAQGLMNWIQKQTYQ